MVERGQSIGVEREDSYAGMVARRELSNLAEVPFDPYGTSLAFALAYFNDVGAPLTECDAVLDVGTSSGRFFLDAAAAVNLPARRIGIDIDRRPFEDFLLPNRDVDTSRFTFIH